MQIKVRNQQTLALSYLLSGINVHDSVSPFVGASHLRNVFYRMGLTDQDIVALSGGHTLVIFPHTCIRILFAGRVK